MKIYIEIGTLCLFQLIFWARPVEMKLWLPYLLIFQNESCTKPTLLTNLKASETSFACLSCAYLKNPPIKVMIHLGNLFPGQTSVPKFENQIFQMGRVNFKNKSVLNQDKLD